MLDFDENAKLEQNSYFADRGLSRYNISSLTVNFPEELDRTQQFAFRESKKYSRADESSKHSHVNEANMNPIVRILGASPSSLVKEFPTGLRILNQNKSKANLQQREK